MSDTPCPAADGSSARSTAFPAAPAMCIDPAMSYSAEMVTTLGTMVIQLDAVTSDNGDAFLLQPAPGGALKHNVEIRFIDQIASSVTS